MPNKSGSPGGSSRPAPTQRQSPPPARRESPSARRESPPPTRREPPRDTFRPSPTVRHEQPKAPVRHEQPKPPVRHEQPKPPVRHDEPKPIVRHEQPKPPVRHEQPKQPVIRHEEPKTTKKTEGPKPPVIRHEEPKTTKKTEGPKPPVVRHEEPKTTKKTEPINRPTGHRDEPAPFRPDVKVHKTRPEPPHGSKTNPGVTPSRPTPPKPKADRNGIISRDKPHFGETIHTNGSKTVQHTQRNADNSKSTVYTTRRPDGTERIKTNTVDEHGKLIGSRITTKDGHGNTSTAKTRGTDNYTSKVDVHHYNKQVTGLRTGGSTYYRDTTYAHRDTTRVTVVINNNHYYTPRYYNNDYGYRSNWGGGFFAGYVAGRIDQAVMDSYYSDYNRLPLYRPYYMPVSAWQPYYSSVLIEPLPVIVPIYVRRTYVDYSVPTSWQTPPLNSSQDPLEQLAQYGQLTQSISFWPDKTLSAIQARDRLNKGLPVLVSGVSVSSYEELSRIVPEMASGARGGGLSTEQRSKLAEAIAPAPETPEASETPETETNSIEDIVANLPSFAKVYSPKEIVSEDEVDGKKINRTMDVAEEIYERPEVKQAVAEWWQANPSADRDALNVQINQIVTNAVKGDLATNRQSYAQSPDLDINPVEYLKDPQGGPEAVTYNLAAIDRVIENVTSQLQTNLICNANK